MYCARKGTLYRYPNRKVAITAATVGRTDSDRAGAELKASIIFVASHKQGVTSYKIVRSQNIGPSTGAAWVVPSHVPSPVPPGDD